MSIAQAFLAEFEQEAQLTRPFLERLPQDKFTWKPHEKSMSAGQLAFHIASAPGGIIQMLVPDTASPPAFAAPPMPESREALLTAFDQSLQKIREILPTFDDEAMAKEWSLTVNNQAVLKLPRAAVIRTILFSHIIQHRGQFGVYLRQLDIPVPSTYGPSADEPPQFMKTVSA